MRTFFPSLVCTLLLLCSVSRSQSSSWSDSAGYPLIRFTAAYGINNGNAESNNIDFHQHRIEKDKNGNPIVADQFTSRGEVTEQTTEYLFTASIRPMNDFKSLNLRVGRMGNAFRYTAVMPQTLPDGSPGGSITAMTDERYTIVPFSFGASISTPRPLFSFYGEVIYALAWMTEEMRYAMPDGSVIRPASTTYRSNGVGFRTGFGITFSLAKWFAVVGDWGYRGLGFYDFSAQDGRENGLNYSISGAYGTVGISVGL